MAGDIRAESEGKVDLTGWYLELVPDDLHHSYRQHLSAKRQGNIDLTEQDYLNIPDYIDGYDDILAVNTFKQGDREVVLGKKINGYSVIMALISNKRKSLHFKNMWGLDTPTYEKRYGKGRGSAASHPGRSSVSANDPPKMIHGASSGLSISQPVQVVNPRLALPGGIPADIPPGLRKLYSLAQEMSTKPQPREIPYRPVQQSPREILTRLAQGMARDSLQGGPLADRSDADIIAMLDEIARRQGRIDKTGNPIENSEQYDILEETGYSIQPITEESIQKVALVQPHGLSKVQAKQLQDAHKKLLHSVMGKPAGTEAYALYSADMSAEIDGGIGEEDGQSVSIPRCTIPHIAIHNHPDNNMFSETDLTTFIMNPQMKCMTVVGNSGNIFSLVKTPEYDGFLFWKNLEDKGTVLLSC